MTKNIRAVVFMADGFEEVEFVTVTDILRRAGIGTAAVSVTGSKEVRGTHDIRILSDEIFENAADIIDGAEILILPGGMPGTDNLRKHEPLAKKLKEFDEKKKLLAAVCAAPMVLERHGVIKNKTVVCYPGCEAEITTAVLGKENVVVSENVITSKGPGTTADFALKIVEMLIGKETADSIAEQMLYKA